MGFIKLFDPAVRDELVAVGFKYTVERMKNNEEVFSFLDSKELREYLMKNFSDVKLVISNKLYF